MNGMMLSILTLKVHLIAFKSYTSNACQRGGAIINLSSIVGAMGNPGQANYVATKAGIEGLTKSSARTCITWYYSQCGSTWFHCFGYDRRTE